MTVADTRPAPDVAELLLRCRFPAPGTEVTCAVSGGADSLALLVLALEAGCVPRVVHVDHRLRATSGRDADHVRAIGAHLGVPVEVIPVAVEPGPNLEARARDARRAALPVDALLGHTADDQAETMLLNLLRGAGPAGLAAMRLDGRRPLLGVRRADTRAVCAARGIGWVDDEMNADPAYRRVRVRTDLVPLLDEIAERDVVEVLVRQAGLFAEVADLVDQLAADLDPTDARGVAGAHPALARAAVRRWIRAGWGGEHPPPLDAVDRVRAVAEGRVRAAELPGGWRVTRQRQRLRLTPPAG